MLSRKKYWCGKKGQGRQNKIVKIHKGTYFDKTKFVGGITWRSLLQRFNAPRNGPGTTKKVKANKYYGYEVEADLTVCRAVKGANIKDHNNLYVVRVRIVKKEEGWELKGKK